MSVFRRYEHLERLGHVETQDIELGLVHVFPKLDGSNSSVWLGSDGKIKVGSRNREIAITQDNHNFAATVAEHAEAFHKIFVQRPDWILYGEWLVPHTIKGYRPEAWRRFYVFDVYDGRSFLDFEAYGTVLASFSLPDFIQIVQPLRLMQSPSQNELRALLDTNTHLMQDGAGPGEGIVIKNYSWKNRFGRQPWAKIVRNEFKEQNLVAFGAPSQQAESKVEELIAAEFCSPTLVAKTRAKVVAAVANETNTDLMSPNAQQAIEATYRARVIPRLLGIAFYDLVQEHIWDAIKKHKNPTIDFGLLQRHTVRMVKEHAKDLFS